MPKKSIQFSVEEVRSIIAEKAQQIMDGNESEIEDVEGVKIIFTDKDAHNVEGIDAEVIFDES